MCIKQCSPYTRESARTVWTQPKLGHGLNSSAIRCATPNAGLVPSSGRLTALGTSWRVKHLAGCAQYTLLGRSRSCTTTATRHLLPQAASVSRESAELEPSFTQDSKGLLKLLQCLEKEGYNTTVLPCCRDTCGQNVVRLLQHAQKAGILESCLCTVTCNQTVAVLYDPDDPGLDREDCDEYVATASSWQTVAGCSIAWSRVQIDSSDTVLQGEHDFHWLNCDDFSILDCDDKRYHYGEDQCKQRCTANTGWRSAALAMWLPCNKWQVLCRQGLSTANRLLETLLVNFQNMADHGAAAFSPTDITGVVLDTDAKTAPDLDKTLYPEADQCNNTGDSAQGRQQQKDAARIEISQLLQAMWDHFSNEPELNQVTTFQGLQFPQLALEFGLPWIPLQHQRHTLQEMQLNPSTAQAYVSAAQTYGWRAMIQTLRSAAQRSLGDGPLLLHTQLQEVTEALDILVMLQGNSIEGIQQEVTSVASMLAEGVLEHARLGGFEHFWLMPAHDPSKMRSAMPAADSARLDQHAKLVQGFAQLLHQMSESMHRSLVGVYLGCLQAFPPVEVLGPACLHLAHICDQQSQESVAESALGKLMTETTTRLHTVAETSSPGVINACLSCACQHCQQLQSFFMHPKTATLEVLWSQVDAEHVTRQAKHIQECSWSITPKDSVCQLIWTKQDNPTDWYSQRRSVRGLLKKTTQLVTKT